MPPKKEKKEKKGGKKGKKDQKAGPSFAEFLDDMFYVSPTEREAIRERNKKRIAEIFSFFGEETADMKDLGVMVRALNFNPSVLQLHIIEAMVALSEQDMSHIMYQKFEQVMLELLETNILKFQELGLDGQPVTKAVILTRESESRVQKTFEALWETMGKKVDQDRSKYIDAEGLREHLTRKECGDEAFDDVEVEDYFAAAQDIGNTFIKEDLFVSLGLE